MPFISEYDAVPNMIPSFVAADTAARNRDQESRNALWSGIASGVGNIAGNAIGVAKMAESQRAAMRMQHAKAQENLDVWNARIQGLKDVAGIRSDATKYAADARADASMYNTDTRAGTDLYKSQSLLDSKFVDPDALGQFIQQKDAAMQQLGAQPDPTYQTLKDAHASGDRKMMTAAWQGYLGTQKANIIQSQKQNGLIDLEDQKQQGRMELQGAKGQQAADRQDKALAAKPKPYGTLDSQSMQNATWDDLNSVADEPTTDSVTGKPVVDASGHIIPSKRAFQARAEMARRLKSGGPVNPQPAQPGPQAPQQPAPQGNADMGSISRMVWQARQTGGDGAADAILQRFGVTRKQLMDYYAGGGQ